jgi:N-glycosylase/DNA lyase
MEYSKIKTSCFDLKHTIESAQPLTFHSDYDASSGFLAYPSRDTIVTLKHAGDHKEATLTVPERHKAEVARRFRLSDNMDKVYAYIDTDKSMKEAIDKYHGMRLTLNDPWETTLCFIISQYNNVKRIRLITKNIVNRFGPEVVENGNLVGRGFPSSSTLAGRPVGDFLKCGAGFRAKYIKAAAKYCTENLNLESLRDKPYEEVKGELMQIPGVGDKVADCIALMGYGKLEAFPVDVHVKRAMEKIYFGGRKQSIDRIQDKAFENWGRMAGYAQQYLFHSSRVGNGKA